MLMTLLPSSTREMRLWEEYQSSLLSFKGLDVMDESPPFKWEWFSEPLDCPSNERCNPESMVGTMSPLEGNPSRAGRKSDVTMNRYYSVRIIFHNTILGLPFRAGRRSEFHLHIFAFFSPFPSSEKFKLVSWLTILTCL